MVEMSELAHILHHADERSLIILDEIGRGTSTYDGISVAWSTLEWICTQIKCRTLFATHYHELTRLVAELPRVANAHMGVEGTRSGGSRVGTGAAALRFLYRLQEGPAQESFGVHVARIAGLPKPVIDRAWKVLEELEKHTLHSGAQASVDQMSLFDSAEPVEAEPVEPHPAIIELERIDVNQMTPVQALNFVVRLREMASAPTSGVEAAR
jgi:DNA mismatch repair protein MutS